MLAAFTPNRLTLQWEPALATYDPDTYCYEEFRLLLLVDGELLLDVHEPGYGFDLGELVRSLANGGFYYLLTCECGDAGCVGIDEAVAVVHEPGYVTWHIASPFTRSLRFASGPYGDTIQAARREVLQFIHRAYDGLCEGDVRLLPDNYWHWPFVQAALEASRGPAVTVGTASAGLIPPA